MKNKAVFLLLVLFSVIIFLGGCETIAGTTQGVAYGVGSTATGMGKDTYNTYNFIQAMDMWFKKNLW